MIRVLQITDCMAVGGIQAFIMNVYRHIDRNQIQFDFLLHHHYANSYDDEIKQMGGKIYYLPARSDGFLKNKSALKAFFKEHTEYDVVHMHESSLSYIEPLVVAKKNGVSIRVFHSHNTKGSAGFLHKFLHQYHKKDIGKVATNYCACGELAAKWMYEGSGVEDKVKVVINGIDVKSYNYNEDTRKQMRQSLALNNDDFVMGHVGRYNTVKNHKFLIEILSEALKKNKNTKLLLAGDGPLMEEIKAYAKTLGVFESVLFLGIRSDIPQLLNAVDAFVLPSLYEGFPVCAIEAQASGLPVFLSDAISKEVCLKENCIMLPLDNGADKWADEILNKSKERITDNEILFRNGFDVSSTVDYLSSIYLQHKSV